MEESSRNAVCVQAWAETIRVFFRNLGVTATHQGRSRTPLTVHVNITKSFRRRKRDECRHKDACPLRGSSERGQKDLPKLARLVRTQTQSIVQDPLSCHRIVRRAPSQSSSVQLSHFGLFYVTWSAGSPADGGTGRKAGDGWTQNFAFSIMRSPS